MIVGAVWRGLRTGEPAKRLYSWENREDTKEGKREAARRDYLRRKEQVKEARKRYYLENMPKVKDRQREYRLKAREGIRERLREYRRANEGALREKRRAYLAQNRERLAAMQRQRRLSDPGAREQQRLYRINHKEALRDRRRLREREKKAPRKTKSWSSPAEVLAFLEHAKEQLHISQPSDWYRISRSEISRVGGKNLFNVFGGLGKALEVGYPDCVWDHGKFGVRGKKSAQRWLCVMLQQVLPEKTHIFEDFSHPHLFWDDISNHKIEIDIWVPEYQLALEYQGEHHYNEICSAYGPLALYIDRDMRKKQRCAEEGITLLTIPYWWDRKKESLTATLHLFRPDIFPESQHDPIPLSPPEGSVGHIKSVMMIPKEWNGEQDPSGWFISEKLNGVRAYWDGSQMMTMSGKTLAIPAQFTDSLPRDVCLEGEL
eukprot:TRINITY_DN3174_c0_g1_i5.p1 TRINITY_DN3174_c0_g1~~TRINITY_DN3174_c0_g1_i5.p1  ORF type:complete len:431 (+),score=96.59 TRINITY_DN3174_c0_g1_i5:19-1311(+)